MIASAPSLSNSATAGEWAVTTTSGEPPNRARSDDDFVSRIGEECLEEIEDDLIVVDDQDRLSFAVFIGSR